MTTVLRSIVAALAVSICAACADVAPGPADGTPGVGETQEYLDRLEAANQRFSKGEVREAIRDWEALRAEDSRLSTWGKVTFNIGIAHKRLGGYDEAIRAFETIFPSKVDDREPGGNLMEEFRNYRYRACLEISSCYEAKGDIARALEYANLAREKYKYQAHCGTCAKEAESALSDRIERLEKQSESKTSGQPQGGANGSQPSRSETNTTSSAAGSRRSP